MRVNAVTLLALIQGIPKATQFTIPIWQRTYSWTEKECGRLWDDILRAGSEDSIQAHFINSIVYVSDDIHSASGHNQWLVIDGQQRLTTTMLILEALARYVGNGEPVPDFSAEKIRNWNLIVPENSGDRRFRLVLTQTDKQTLFALLSQKSQPKDFSQRIAKNFKFFEEKMQSLESIEPICKGLAKLVVVDIALDRNHDNPQLIFESMNSTGLDLTQADLIRNYVLMDLDIDQQTQIYEDHWRRIETSFGQEAYSSQFDRFMRDYLTLKTREIPNIRAVYESFKANVPKSNVTETIAKVQKYAEYYCSIALEQEKDAELLQAFRDMMELKVDVSIPFLLEMYNDYALGELNKRDFLAAIRLVESYVFRRAVCNIPTNTLNKTFANFGREIRKGDYLASICDHFRSLDGSRRFPDDAEFQNDLIHRNSYNFKRKDYLLRRMENHDRKEPVAINEYSTEHILPQNENLSVEWQDMLGSDWLNVRSRWLHTIGNLTLTGYNSEYGDRPFLEKRDMHGGFRESPLHLNKELGILARWNEDAIKERATKLAARAVQIWPAVPAH